jgi:NCAIR mutase (PurE)-related protein
MDIFKYQQALVDAKEDENTILEQMQSEYETLSDAEKLQVEKDCAKGIEEAVLRADRVIHDVEIALITSEISKYVSMSRIAKDYFGKSKEWLYQRIKGYKVNGKAATFTPSEKQKFSDAMDDISRIAKETAFKLS